MDNTIIVAIVTGGFAFLGSLVASVSAQNKTIYRIDLLEKKVDKHNQMVERTYILEEKMKVANHRIEDLEKK